MKLTADGVEIVRQALKRGLIYRDIATLTGINVSTISTIAFCCGLSRRNEDPDEARTKRSVVKALTEMLADIKAGHNG
jgi:hypothetical protein